MTTPAATALVDRLERAGHVERRPSPNRPPPPRGRPDRAGRGRRLRRHRGDDRGHGRGRRTPDARRARRRRPLPRRRHRRPPRLSRPPLRARPGLHNPDHVDPTTRVRRSGMIHTSPAHIIIRSRAALHHPADCATASWEGLCDISSSEPANTHRDDGGSCGVPSPGHPASPPRPHRKLPRALCTA